MRREERDLIGVREVPEDVYWGIHTLRALENFPLTGIPLSSHPELVVALAAVKEAAALAHMELGTLPGERAGAVVAACREIRAGRLHDQFVVDVFQGGAGTSANMNANEVVANRALEILGHPRGCYEHLHPNDDVNRSQSTNDAYPTAAKLALYASAGRLLDAMTVLRDAFGDRGGRFAKTVKLGRTQLQDAVPMTLGREFDAFALTVRDDAELIGLAAASLLEVNLGARRSAPGSTRTRASPGWPSPTSKPSHPCRSGPPATWWRARRASADSSVSPAPSVSSPYGCPRSATTSGCSPRAPGRASARSGCRSSRPGPASCRAR
ncbi:hypothetical protein GCM10010497_24300 [Streptomyces cinereoruber]|uniref:Fumarate lyase N-terminal domain-containing protein n=1 Tax=Streptomyces cinereoruber TaxID=67260 RepID=A0AAV4KIE1_9ACTN|nr:aspartate ammonia-lyase [Streptomyces cinereoruber]NIH63923.1 aspartate ammonia-lyase [Streptomyces cinereoruber]GGR21084.1 hypothetical protein GCM10010497_24300 [Streptomyces cinereoruber]